MFLQTEDRVDRRTSERRGEEPGDDARTQGPQGKSDVR